MRYAKNAAHGEGLVFNPGERVEGYTNFLWVIILAAIARAGIPLVEGARALSLAFSAGTLAVAWLFCAALLRGEENGPAGSAAAAPLILAAAVPFAVWASSGTEIPLFTFLLTTGAFFLAKGRGPRSVLTLFALLTLVRPEGAAYFLLAAALLAARGEKRKKVAAEALLAAALMIAPFLVWKTWYYGSPIPNTFYAKTGAGAVQLRNGFTYVARFAAWYIWLPAAAFLLLRRKGTKGPRFASVTVPLSFTGLNWLLAALLGGDWMPQFRFLVPTLPLIAVMAGAAVPRAASIASTRRGGERVSAAAITLVFACLALAPGSSDYGTFRLERLAVESFGRVGGILGRRFPAGTVIGAGSTGAIGYYSGLPIVDILGLTEPEIARKGKIVADQPGHMRSLGAHVLDREPDILLLGNVQIHRGRKAEDLGRIKIQERDIVLDPRFSRDYGFTNIPLGGDFFLSAYVRRGSPAALE